MKKTGKANIPAARLVNQQLLRSQLSSPKEVVAWMGAMQAQDYKMALRAVALRLSGTSVKANEAVEAVEAAFNRGEILRTHILRPTWHFVSPDDICWMLALTGDRIKVQAHSRDLDLGLNEAIFEHGNEVITQTLKGGKSLSRDEMAQALEDAGIDTGNYRITHLLMRAELDAIICSGPVRGKTQTYALLDERAPQVKSQKKKPFDRDEALAELAQRYFTSHGPATIKDFSWWSGLTMTDARQATEATGEQLSSEELDGVDYYFMTAPRAPKPSGRLHFLPAFDEYIIAYTDRSAVLAPTHHSKAVANNGIFRPTILRDGIVVGIWKVTGKKTTETYFE